MGLRLQRGDNVSGSVQKEVAKRREEREVISFFPCRYFSCRVKQKGLSTADQRGEEGRPRMEQRPRYCIVNRFGRTLNRFCSEWREVGGGAMTICPRKGRSDYFTRWSKKTAVYEGVENLKLPRGGPLECALLGRQGTDVSHAPSTLEREMLPQHRAPGRAQQ